ncbi:hypothetical protein H6G97_47420 [Nostoc flagelliforme FACHB-838]|uniref:Uncharacterized protein n=1 Tax=Nostoc flagelliforme FACHB-838 TaxID=2692904 RepID=A0ABR8E778_9NOSO|nr:hypothetical protein [Nostoc flagelliforme]MBD2536503.1 hypothetical protein [Nostoc flagelliforme FACHB-838]
MDDLSKRDSSKNYTGILLAYLAPSGQLGYIYTKMSTVALWLCDKRTTEIMDDFFELEQSGLTCVKPRADESFIPVLIQQFVGKNNHYLLL